MGVMDMLKNTARPKAIQQIALDSIQPDQEQVRKEFDLGSLTELAESIREHGVQNPIHVVKNGSRDYKILTGERRYRASKVAGQTSIPCIVHDTMDDDRRMVLQLVENLQRENLTAVETIRGFGVLKSKGMSSKDIAKTLGISKAQVSKGMKVINELTKEQLDQVANASKAPSIQQLYDVAQKRKGGVRSEAISKLVDLPQEIVEDAHEAPRAILDDATATDDQVKEVVEHDDEISEKELWSVLKKLSRKDMLVKAIGKAKAKKILEEYGK